MPITKRKRPSPTHEWDRIDQLPLWPEQRRQEVMRTCVLFGQSPAERVQRPTLSPRLRQLIVDPKTECPAIHLREIAAICYTPEGRRPSTSTIQRILAEGPPPTRTTRRWPPYHKITGPAQRRLALIRLHAEGWRESAIAGYMGVSRQTVYTTLQRWVAEQFAGMPDKPRAPKTPARKVDLAAMREITRLRQNPELGAWRMQAAQRQLGIRLSARTCGRSWPRTGISTDSGRARQHPRTP